MKEPSSVHILLVDDDPLNLRLYGNALANEGFQLLYAHDGNEGREMARRFHPDLVILDMNMPVMDGAETTARLKSETETSAIPIILLTSGDLPIEAEKAMRELGIADYLHKGIDLKELVRRVKNVLQEK